MLSRLGLAAALVCAPLVFAAPVDAQPAAAQSDPPAPLQAEEFVLQFDGSAYGIVPLGGANLRFRFDDQNYRAAATITSGGLAALFDRTELRAQSAGAANGVAWRTFNLDHSYARKRRVSFLENGPDGVSALVTPAPSNPGEPPPTPAQKAGARDPLAALAAMGRQVAQTGNCAGVFPIFDGRFLYTVTLTREGTDRMRADGFDGPVLKCKMRYQPIAGYRAGTQMGRRIPQGEIWFAKIDGARMAPPVKVSAPLPLGHAAIRLTSLKRAEVTVESTAAGG
jgi:hypothetical protein